MTTKTIGIDIRAAKSPVDGKGRYTFELVKALLNSAPDTQFFLFTTRPNPEFSHFDNAHQICIRGRSIFWHLNLKKYLEKNPVSLFLSPTSYIYPAIAPKEQKTAIIVHDLITFLYTKDHPIFPTIVERLALPRALKKVSFCFCVSQNTLKDLNDLFPHSKKIKSAIVSPAVSAGIHRVDTQKMDLPDNFILAIGTLPRKNVQGIVDAFNLLKTKDLADLHLCIAGKKPVRAHGLIPGAKIHFLGTVTEPQLCELYSRAKILVFPSFYEGFGMPPLEAMACGCPVIVSNVSSLPEVVDGAAIQVDPNSPHEIATAIAALLPPSPPSVDYSLAHSHAQKGLLRSHHFSWEASAKEILKTIF